MVRQDESVLRSSMMTGVDGVKSIVDGVAKGTPEMKRLLSQECDVILECKFCRAMFRSLINFVSHKRTFCRNSFVKAQEHDNQQDEDETDSVENQDEDNENETEGKEGSSRKKMVELATGSRRRKRESAATRTLNPMTRIVKRMGTTTVRSDDGKTIMQLHTLPAIAKVVPKTIIVNGVQQIVDEKQIKTEKADDSEEHVMMVMPQDCTSAYLNMQLRRRKEKPVAAKKFTENEAAIVGRLINHSDIEPDTKMCNREHCHTRFEDVGSLAVHTSIYHTPLHPTKELKSKLLCFLCGETCTDKGGMKVHVLECHEDESNVAVLSSDDDETGEEDVEEDGSKKWDTETSRAAGKRQRVKAKTILGRSTASKLIKKYSKARIAQPVKAHASAARHSPQKDERIEDYSFIHGQRYTQYRTKSASRVRCSVCSKVFQSRKSAAAHWRNNHLRQQRTTQRSRRKAAIPIQNQQAEKKQNVADSQYTKNKSKSKSPAPASDISEGSGSSEDEVVEERQAIDVNMDIDSDAPKRSARLARRSAQDGQLSIMDRLTKKKELQDQSCGLKNDNITPAKSRQSADRASSTSHSSNEKTASAKSDSGSKPKARDLNSVVDTLVKELVKHESAEQMEQCKRSHKKRKLDEILCKPESDSRSPVKSRHVNPILSLTHAKQATVALNSETVTRIMKQRDMDRRKAQLDAIYENSKKVEQKRKESLDLETRSPRSLKDSMRFKKRNSLPAPRDGKTGVRLSPVKAVKDEQLVKYEQYDMKDLPPPPYYSPPGDPPNWMFLARKPVTLDDDQKAILNSVLDDEMLLCKKCKRTFGSTKLVRTHVMNHINLVRFKCTCCDAASFFCADMRRHLVYGFCPGQKDRDFVKPGKEMTKEIIAEVDKLIALVDPADPCKIENWKHNVISSEKLGAKCYKTWRKADEATCSSDKICDKSKSTKT